MGIFDTLSGHNHRIPALHLSVRPKAQKEANKSEQNKDISQLITHRLMSLTLTDNRGFEADQLDIELSDSDGLLEIPSRGAILSLGLGWKNEPLTFKGEYSVEEIEHSGTPDKLTIRARSADLQGKLSEHKERSFHQTTLGKIVEQIANESQLKATIGKEFEHYPIKHIDQTNESSINLLTRLAKEHDAIVTVKNGRLLFIKAGNSTTASGKPLGELIITRKSGDNHRFAIAEGDNYKAVKAYWHDTATGKRGEVIFDENTEVRKVKKATTRQKTKVKRDKQGKIIKGKDGKSIKETTTIAGKGRMKKEVVQTKPIESDSEKIKTLRHTYASERSAINACKRHFEKLQRGVATFSLDLGSGNAELIPELPIQVQGFKAEIDATQWIITQVTHSLNSSSGFTTSIECELKTDENEN